MKPITNGHGVLKSITRAQYRAGDWECVGEDDYTALWNDHNINMNQVHMIRGERRE